MKIFLGGFENTVRILKKCGLSVSTYHKEFLDTFYGMSSKKDLSIYDGYNIMLDSGAFSFFAANYRKTGKLTGDYYKTKEFEKYFESYISFLKKHGNRFMTYVNLDVIYNAEQSLKNYQIMVKEGLKPMSVYHAGSDWSYLDGYIKDQCEWIGIGGIAIGAKEGSMEELECSLRGIFDYLKDKYGEEVFERKKLHSFGVTSFYILREFPFFSADSTTYLRNAGYGRVSFLLEKGSITLVMSDQSNYDVRSLNELSEYEWKSLEEKAASLGLTLKKIQQSNELRNFMNILYYHELAKQIEREKEERKSVGKRTAVKLF